MKDMFIKLRNLLKSFFKILSDTWSYKPSSEEIISFDPPSSCPDKLLDKIIVGDRSYVDMEEYFKENHIKFDLNSLESSKVIKKNPDFCQN